MADPEISSEPGKFQKVAKAAAELQTAADGYAAYREVEQQLEEAKAMLKESQGATTASVLHTPMPDMCNADMGYRIRRMPW